MSENTSTHGSRWFSSLTSHPWTQISMFIFFFVAQIILFVIFVQEVFFEEHTEIKTSMEFLKTDDVEFPQITICSTTFYSKEKFNGNSWCEVTNFVGNPCRDNLEIPLKDLPY